jgi:hypothetical protein
MKSQTIDEKFPILIKIDKVPIEACRVAYDRLDSILAGRHTDDLNRHMATGGTTRSWVWLCLNGRDASKYKKQDLDDFALAAEYAYRQSHT